MLDKFVLDNGKPKKICVKKSSCYKVVYPGVFINCVQCETSEDESGEGQIESDPECYTRRDYNIPCDAQKFQSGCQKGLVCVYMSTNMTADRVLKVESNGKDNSKGKDESEVKDESKGEEDKSQDEGPSDESDRRMLNDENE